MLPNAPTDNLYKFMTFLGISLFAFCTWQMTSRSQLLETGLTDIAFRRALVEMRSDRTHESIKILDRLTAAPMADVSEETLKRWRSETEALLLAVEQQVADLEQVFTEKVRTEFQQEQYVRHERVWLKAGQAAGLAMLLLGSILWYILHQRHQDRLIAAQAREAVGKADGAA